VQPELYTTNPDLLRIHTQTVMAILLGPEHYNQEKDDRMSNTVSRVRKVVGIRRVLKLALPRGLGRRLLVMLWKLFLQRVCRRRVWSLLETFPLMLSHMERCFTKLAITIQESPSFITAVAVPRAHTTMLLLHAFDSVPLKSVPPLQLSSALAPFLRNTHASVGNEGSMTVTTVVGCRMSVSWRKRFKVVIVPKEQVELRSRKRVLGG
jgi:hypothetical protein